MAQTSPSALISVFVALIIGASLVGPLAGIVIAPGVNVTGAALAMYSLLTLFFVIAVIMVAVKAIR